jgi:hypothetical protein
VEFEITQHLKDEPEKFIDKQIAELLFCNKERNTLGNEGLV